jgi:hypothetical protein
MKRAAKTPEVPPAKVIGHDEDEVGLFQPLGICGAETSKHWKCGEDVEGEEVLHGFVAGLNSTLRIFVMPTGRCRRT